jgi:hypothetical protein
MAERSRQKYHREEYPFEIGIELRTNEPGQDIKSANGHERKLQTFAQRNDKQL